MNIRRIHVADVEISYERMIGFFLNARFVRGLIFNIYEP